MKRVLIVIDNILYKNGTERAVSNLANMLTINGDYQVTIVSVKSEYGQPAFKLDERINVIFLGIKFSGKIINHIHLYFKVLKNLKEIAKEYDYVIGTESGFNYILPYISKNIKTIGCEHFSWAKTSRHHKILRKLFYPKLNAVVLLTQKDFENYSFLKNAHVIQNSISFENSEFSSYESKTLIAIGRLMPQKGFDYLINIAAKLKTQIPGYKVKIYGEGPEKQNLLDSINKLGIESFVEILPPTNDIQSVYKNASLYLMTSRFEGLPMVLIEAQSYGLPIVSFNCPEGPEEVIINGKNGYLVNFEDCDEFVNKTLEILNHKELWEKMSHNSLSLNTRFSTLEIYYKWNELMESL